MLPVDFEGTNIVLGPPIGWTEEDCTSISAFKSVDESGQPFFLTAWKPNKEDLDALNRGEPIYLKTIGEGYPPTAMFTLDEKGGINQ